MRINLSRFVRQFSTLEAFHYLLSQIFDCVVLVLTILISFLNFSNQNTLPLTAKTPFTREMMYLVMVIVESAVGKITSSHQNHAFVNQDSG
jgi:hypothetical protein